jgi:small subunit ribosomal protein S20
MRNRVLKTRIKNVTKEVRQMVSEQSSEKALKSLDLAKSVIDKAAKKGAVHQRTAARKISRISKLVNTI